MGGGVWFAGGVTGTLLNVTVAGNAGNGIAGGDTGVTLQNTLVAGNTQGASRARSAATTHAGAGANMEYPGRPELAVHPVRSSSPTPSSGRCRTTAASPDDGPRRRQPRDGQGDRAARRRPAGTARQSPCTLGAYEVP